MIGAAIKSGQRPTALISGDPYWGHRSEVEALDVPDPALAHVPTSWDLALLRAYEIIQAYTGENGQLAWVDASPDVYWRERRGWSGHDEALEKAKEDAGDLPKGQYIYMEPEFDFPDDPPSLSKWVQQLDKDREEDMVDDAPRQEKGRPPTPAELAALNAKRNS